MALDLFVPMSGRLVLDTVNALRERSGAARVKAYDYRGHFFEGGEKTKEYLVRHQGEAPDPWAERQARFSDCGITSRAASALISAIAGHEIKREIEGASDATNAAFSKVLADSRMASKQRMLAQNQVVCGDAVAFIGWSDALQMLLVHSVDPGNFDMIAHPDDPMREGIVFEHRIDERDKSGKAMIHWIWTDQQKNLIDDDGVELDQGDGTKGWQLNPYGVIPFVHYAGLPLSESYWGRSPVSATIEIHRYANNLRSQQDRLILMQAHSQLVISDSGFTEKITTGESNTIVLSADGTAAFLAPGADIAALETAYQRTIDEAFQLVGMPMSIVKGGEVPSGYALVVAYQGKAEIVEDLAVEYKAAEEELIRKVCTIGSKHGLPFPSDPIPVVDLNIEVVPADRDGAKQADMQEVLAGARTMRDYVAKWVLPKGTDDAAIDAYMAQLEADKVRAGFGAPTSGSVIGAMEPGAMTRESML